MKTLNLLSLLASLLISISAMAQIDDREDVVYLKNGTIYRGTLIEQIFGVSCKIEIAGGSVVVLKEAEIEKITKEKRENNPDKVYVEREYIIREPRRKERPEFKYREKGYFFQGHFEAGFFNIGTRIINGYKFNQYAALAFGFGIMGLGSDVYVNTNSTYSGLYLPLFAYFTGDILKKKITPFYQFEAGYAFWPKVNTNPFFDSGSYDVNTTVQAGGFMGGGGFGCRFYKYTGVHISISANCTVINPTLTTTSTYTDYFGNNYFVTTKQSPWLVVPSFKFGIGF